MPNASDVRRYERRTHSERLACSHARRARDIAGHWNATWSARQWQSLLAEWDYTCYPCERRFPADQLEPEHLVPISRGGRNCIANILPACRACNSRKGSRALGEYLAYLDMKESNQ